MLTTPAVAQATAEAVKAVLEYIQEPTAHTKKDITKVTWQENHIVNVIDGARLAFQAARKASNEEK